MGSKTDPSDQPNTAKMSLTPLTLIILLVCVSLTQGLPYPSLNHNIAPKEYRITRGRSGLGGANVFEEERKRRHILSLVSDVLAATWALESARPYQGHQGLRGALGGVRVTNDRCYQEACEGGSCQCCNCYDCWAC